MRIVSKQTGCATMRYTSVSSFVQIIYNYCTCVLFIYIY